MLFVLSLAPVFKQKCNKLINGKSQTNRDKKSDLLFLKWHNYIEEFDLNLIKIDKKSYKDIDVYYIGYIKITKIDDCEKIYSVYSSYLITDKVDEHIECKSVERSSAGEKNGKKYLVFDFTDENEEVLKKYTDFWDGIKNKIEKINGSKKGEYGKDFMKIKFNTDDNLPLSKPLKLDLLTTIVRCIFEEDSKFYPQLYLDDCLYELRV